MGDPFDELSLPPMMPLRPRPRGSGLPVPPVIPLVAVISVLLGLAMGYGLAPKPHPSASPNSPSPSSQSVAVPSANPSAYLAAVQTGPPVGTAEIPPPGGLSLAQALEAFRVSFGPPTDVISARVGRYPAVSPGWVWLIVIPYSSVACEDQLPRVCRWISTTEMVILDYRTGELLEDRIPAG